MLIGYARKSTSDQRLDLQIHALEQAGCQQIFSDTASGSLDDRKGLQDALNALEPGDVLVVFKLDRLGRSLRHLVRTIGDLGRRGVGFRSLNESLDTTSPGGKLTFHIFSALAEYELEIIRMRTRAGLEAAKAKGRFGGRPQKMNPQTIATARRLLADPEMRMDDVCLGLGVSKSTVYRYLAKREAAIVR